MFKPITDTEGRVRVESRKDLSCFVIEGAERSDEGNYTIIVTNPAGEDKAVLFIKIVGKGTFAHSHQILCLTKRKREN